MFSSCLAFLFIVATNFGAVELRDDYKMILAPRSEKNVKIPKVIQRMYREWTSKPKYESKLIQSIPVQATLLNDHSLLMTFPTLVSKNTTVRKVELWMEFHNVPQPSKVRHTEHAVEVQPVSDSHIASCITNITKKPHFRDRQIEMGVDITSLYVDCLGKDAVYHQLKLRISTQSTNTANLATNPFDAFIILQEVVQQDVNEPENSPAAESGKKMPQKERNKRLRRNKRSNDHSNSIFVGHVIKQFKITNNTESAKEIVDAAQVMKEFVEYQGKRNNRRRQIAREKVMDEIRKNIHQHTYDSREKVTGPPDSFRKVKTMRDRQRRRISKSRQYCGLHQWYVKFEDIGWNWVIAPPKGFEANRCYGKCSFPLSSHMNSTNHAVVQTLMNSIFGKPKSSCCVPNETSALTLLFLEDNGIITMKKYPDMIVNSCACL